MAVYVDEVQGYAPAAIQPAARRCGRRWSHLWADTRDELHEFAAQLGLRRAWFQERPILFHYDVTPAVRARAIRLGAVALDAEESRAAAYRRVWGEED